MTPNNPLRAALWMMIAVLSFTAMALAGRALGPYHDTLEILFFRPLVGIVIVLAIGGLAGTLGQIQTTRLGLHGLRNSFHFAGQNLWFYAVTVLPLAQVFALEFTTPIWVALLSPLFLGERLTGTRIGAATLGFLGVLIVAQPQAMTISWGVVAGASCALAFAGTYMTTKGLARHESTTSILFWLAIMQAMMGAVAVFADGRVALPTGDTLPLLILIGCCGLLSHYCITTALHLAPATIVAPFEFVRLPLAAFIGFLFYEERLGAAIFLGAALVLSANFINIRAERRPPHRTP